jgi:hypothetical protein
MDLSISFASPPLRLIGTMPSRQPFSLSSSPACLASAHIPVETSLKETFSVDVAA